MKTFVGSGNIPEAAIKESSVKARDFLSNLNGNENNSGMEEGEGN